jgi:hypothetical protein
MRMPNVNEDATGDLDDERKSRVHNGCHFPGSTKQETRPSSAARLPHWSYPSRYLDRPHNKVQRMADVFPYGHER